MYGEKPIRSALSWGLALLLSAIATAPLWHAPHPNRADSAAEETHTHSGRSVGLCDDYSVAPETECTLCLTKRLLSTSLADQVDDPCGPPPDSCARGEVVLDTFASDRIRVPTRAPPLS